jgi:hypothetical protein
MQLRERAEVTAVGADEVPVRQRLVTADVGEDDPAVGEQASAPSAPRKWVSRRCSEPSAFMTGVDVEDVHDAREVELPGARGTGGRDDPRQTEGRRVVIFCMTVALLSCLSLRV